MKIATAISGIKSYLEGLSWTSDDGGGTTSFQVVFDYRNFVHDDGSPFVCVYEGEGSTEALGNMARRYNKEIIVDFCHSWAETANATEEDARAEARLRVREIYDYVRPLIVKYAQATTFSSDLVYNLSDGFVDDELENNVVVMRLRFNLSEVLTL